MTLNHLIKAKTDIKPNMSGANWEWRETAPWPPVARVLKTQFWSNEDYKPVWERLIRPAAKVECDHGGTFSTVRTTVLKKTKAQEGIEEVCST